jgi:hypothetical protein
VKITAAVSLLVCGEEVAKRPLLEWLESGSLWTKRRVVMELLRVKERQQLAFLNTALKALQSNEQTKDFREVLSELLK